ncbi:MAG TPA: transcriptional repressor [bacterium]|nr:transcriptional repressor [bacterium]
MRTLTGGGGSLPERPQRLPAPASGSPRVQAPRRAEGQRAAQHNYAKEKSRFVEFLGTKKLKLTRQREVVLREVFGGFGHFEAEEVVERLKAKRSRVSRATVYRTLELLQECQLVEKVNFGTARSFYEHVHLGEHHDHMICTRCNVVIEFYDRRLEALQDEICRKHGIHLRSHSMRLFGECQVCRLGKDG